VTGLQLGASLRAFLGKHCQQLTVHLVLRDFGTVDECGGTELAWTKATTADQQPHGSDPNDPEGGTTGCADGSQDASHSR
jgi:hypothetical protein